LKTRKIVEPPGIGKGQEPPFEHGTQRVDSLDGQKGVGNAPLQVGGGGDPFGETFVGRKKPGTGYFQEGEKNGGEKTAPTNT